MSRQPKTDDRVDNILHACVFALGQGVGPHKPLDFEAIVWLRDRYREKFLHAIVVDGNSWTDDGARVMAVGRFMGQRAAHHASRRPSIDLDAAAEAAREIEESCQMRRRACREGPRVRTSA